MGYAEDDLGLVGLEKEDYLASSFSLLISERVSPWTGGRIKIPPLAALHPFH